jgi:hypothetical protein
MATRKSDWAPILAGRAEKPCAHGLPVCVVGAVEIARCEIEHAVAAERARQRDVQREREVERTSSHICEAGQGMTVREGF